jgi:CYTH domain-containing protein
MNESEIVNPKYSLLEIEKKWTINKDKLHELSNCKLIQITDKYFPDTRTRLRKMVDTETGDIKYKLTKKYGKISSQCEPLTTLYLSENEFNLFNELQGYILIKDIYRYTFSDTTFLVEFFIKPKVDFILLEVEAKTEIEINELIVPDFAETDVTNIKEYEGYSIAAKGVSQV